MIDAPLPIDAALVQTLQQTTDNVIAASNSLACRNGLGETAEISWYRVFSLADHNITNRPFYVTQVTVAFQEAYGNPPGQVKIGRYGGALGGTTLDLAQVTAINAANISIPSTTTGVQLPVPIAATIQPNSNFIVEIHSPDFRGAGKATFIGASTSPGLAGRTGYYRAPSCSPSVPTAVAAVGFPSAHLIITVTGQY